jgi:hypothetical protein
MSTIVKKSGSYPAPGYLEETESGRKFRRIVGGFAWPGKKPGFVVAVGEELEPDPKTEKRHLWVVGETESLNVETLAKRAIEFLEIYHVEAFYGNRENEPMMRLLRNAGLSLHEAPYADNEHSFSFYLATIRGCLDPEKYLHFGDGSKLPGYLLEATPENASQGAEDFPAIAALGYAVSHLRFNKLLPPLPENKKPFNFAKSYSVNLDFKKRRDTF